MGNCTGFCMTSASDESQQKKVTADKVKSALYEKDELFKESNQYDDLNQNGGSKSGQPRRLLNLNKNSNQTGNNNF